MTLPEIEAQIANLTASISAVSSEIGQFETSRRKVQFFGGNSLAEADALADQMRAVHAQMESAYAAKDGDQARSLGAEVTALAAQVSLK